jgi:hypothetical protein
MRQYIISSIAFLVCFSFNISASAQQKVAWFFTPEFSLMLHGDHLGKTVGFQTGVSLLQRRLQAGLFYYGRSGPINSQTYTVDLPEGQSYLGQPSVLVRADHGAFGLILAPQFPLRNGWTLDIPLNLGQMGAGFYLFGENRLTPDGARVSTWENKLMDSRDAGFSLLFEGGVRIKAPLGKDSGMQAVAGIHYAYAPGWDTFVGGTDFYNLPRVSLGIQFGQ